MRNSAVLFLLVGTLGCSLDRTQLEGETWPSDAALDAGTALDADAGSSSNEDAGTERPDAGLDEGGLDAASDDGGRDAGSIPCTLADEGCTDGVMRTCNAGTLETRTCSNLGCNAEGTACAILMPSNLTPRAFMGTASPWEVSADQTYDTDACASGVLTAQQIRDSQEVCVRLVTTMSVASNATLNIVGARPLIVLAFRDVSIDGTLDLSARGPIPRAGGGIGGSTFEGAIGAFPGRNGTASGHSSSGGGGGGFCGAGEMGGAGGGVAGGAGGVGAPSDYALEPLRGGSGGGFGHGQHTGAVRLSAGGGAGGGAIQISSRGTIIVRGSILAGGGGGGGGGATDEVGHDLGAGGGGGSGGGVLLEAVAISISPGARVWMTGGGGGGGASREGARGQAGGPGENGGTTGTRALGGAAGGPSLGASGGRGGGGSTPAGEPGAANTSEDGNGGGGGGGAGCIVLRTATGTLPADRTPFSSSSAEGLRAFVAHHD